MAFAVAGSGVEKTTDKNDDGYTRYTYILYARNIYAYKNT